MTSTRAWAASSEVNGPAAAISGRNVPWKRSTFPFWFGEAGAVNRCRIPFFRQILSNSTSPRLPAYRLNRSVNCVPLSVITSSGTPYRASAWANARHTARAVARSTTTAITQNREWSSIPVTTFASRTSPVTASTSSTPPTTSMPHSCIGPGRSKRTYALRGFFRGRALTRSCRRSIRLIVATDGTTTGGIPASGMSLGSPPSDVQDAFLRSSSSRIRFAPHRGCSRRSSHTATATDSGAWCGHPFGRCDRSARPATPSTRYRPSHECTVDRCTPYRNATSTTSAPARTSRTASNRCSTTDKTTRANPGLLRSRRSHGERHRPRCRTRPLSHIS
jgi:hypothetical protein